MEYSITDEFSTQGDYSLKAISHDWQWVYYGISNTLFNQITTPFTFKCDVSTTGGELLIVVVEEGSEKQSSITLSSGEYPVEITYTPTTCDFGKIELGYRSKADEQTCYIDNIRIYIQ